MHRLLRLAPASHRLHPFQTITRSTFFTRSSPALNQQPPSDTTQSDPAPSPSNAAPPTTTVAKAKSIIGSLLHGTGESDESFAQMAQETHSKILARGKYVHELQTHNVKPEAWDDYVGLISETYPRIAEDPKFQVKLYGSWATEIGPLDQAVHIWEYNHYPGYEDTTSMLKTDPTYQKFLKKMRPMLRERQNQMMLEFDFWMNSGPAIHNGIYELRTYQLKPGRMLEWATEWEKGLGARKAYVQPVGAWFSQIGDLHIANHMWVYPNLQVRKEMREACWKVDGWAKTVYNTVRMVDHMECRI
ncbi:hypothetical protein HDV05_000265, partial [Chytridiales sp. JEL 0842]